MSDTPSKRSIENGEEGSPAPKRGRGRPRKGPNAPPSNDSSTPRKPHGRPSKGSITAPSPPEESNAPLRGRGRPSKTRRGRPPKDHSAPASPEEPLPAEAPLSTDPPIYPSRTPSSSDRERSEDAPASTVQSTTAEPQTAQSEKEPLKDTKSSEAGPKRRGRPPKDPSEKVTKEGYKGKQTRKAKATGILQDILGTYDLRCEGVEDNWPDVAGDMSLTINPLPQTSAALIGSFQLGHLEGTMLLSADENFLERARKQMDKGDDPPKTKTSASPAITDRTVHFRWRGRNTGDDDQVHPGMNGNQKGILKFTNDKLVKFKGTGAFPALGEACTFFGTYFEGQAGSEPLPWSTFSEEAAEEANRARWH